MTLTQMRYFCEVCRWQNITQAAQSLHIAQPTISIAMQSLENETGLNLFHREHNRIIVTQDGNVLLGKINAILEQVDALEADVQEMSRSHRRIRMSMPVQQGITFLPAMLGDFHWLYPEIKVSIVEMGGISALHMVEEDRLDLAFTNFQKDISEKLEYHKLLDCECCFCTWEGHPLSGKKKVSIKEVAATPLVLLDNHFVSNHLAGLAFSKAKAKPNVLHYTPYLHTAKNLVRMHLASTLLVRQAVLPEEKYVMIPLETPMFIESGIVRKKARQVSPDEKTIMEYLKRIASAYIQPQENTAKK